MVCGRIDHGRIGYMVMCSACLSLERCSESIIIIIFPSLIAWSLKLFCGSPPALVRSYWVRLSGGNSGIKSLQASLNLQNYIDDYHPTDGRVSLQRC